MVKAQAVLYIIAIILLVAAAFPIPSKVRLACLAGAFALTGFALPTLNAL